MPRRLPDLPDPASVLGDRYLWVLVLVTTGFAVALFGYTAGLSVFVGGLLGVVVLTLIVWVVESLRQPQYDNKIDPWADQ
jgi:hypothetical protein